MVNNGTGSRNIFRVVEHIMLEDIQNIAYGYFLLQVIGNVKQILPNPLTVSSLTLLYVGNAIEIKYIWYGALVYDSQGNWRINYSDIS